MLGILTGEVTCPVLGIKKQGKVSADPVLVNVDVDGQLNAPASLFPWKEPSVSTKQKGGWVPQRSGRFR